MSSPCISLKNVTVGYPRVPVLERVTLDIFPGDSYAVLGPNGSGKTAFLKTVAGIIPPLTGELQRRAPEKSNGFRVGYVPQRGALSGLLPLTVGEVIQMGTYGNLRPWEKLRSVDHERIQWAHV